MLLLDKPGVGGVTTPGGGMKNPEQPTGHCVW